MCYPVGTESDVVTALMSLQNGDCELIFLNVLLFVASYVCIMYPVELQCNYIQCVSEFPTVSGCMCVQNVCEWITANACVRMHLRDDF